MNPIRIALPITFAAVAFAAAGCGGSASSAGGGATGTVAGTAATLTTSTSTTAQGTASFDARYGAIRRRLVGGLRQLEKGDLAAAGTVLTTCTDAVTSKLGTRARTAKQQQAVSLLRTACDDIAQAQAKSSKGDTAGAQQLAKDALAQLRSAAAAAG